MNQNQTEESMDNLCDNCRENEAEYHCFLDEIKIKLCFKCSYKLGFNETNRWRLPVDNLAIFKEIQIQSKKSE